MSICDNTTVNEETTLKLQSIRKTKISRNGCKTTFNDPRIRWGTVVLYKKSTAVRYSVSSTNGTGNGTKKVPRYFNTRYCPPLDLGFIMDNDKTYVIDRGKLQRNENDVTLKSGRSKKILSY